MIWELCELLEARLENEGRGGGDLRARPPHPAERAAEAQGAILERLVSILDAVASHPSGAAPAQVRAATSLPASTCYRLLGSLVSLSMLERIDDRYVMGARMRTWGSAAPRIVDLAALAQPILDHLRDLTGEAATLFVRHGDWRVLEALAPSRHAVIFDLRVGEIMPLHAGSGGRVLLAFDDELAERILQRPLTAETPGTMVRAAALRSNLRKVRHDGFAIGVAERALGAASVSVPVARGDGRICAAISIAGPLQRCSAASLREFVPDMREAAQALGQVLTHYWAADDDPAARGPQSAAIRPTSPVLAPVATRPVRASGNPSGAAQ